MTIGSKQHILTVLLHDYYHRCVFNKVIGRRQWHRLASRIDQNVDKVRALLAAHNAKATFFTLGWLAEQRPELILRLVADGHEIASAGYVPQEVRRLSPQEFRDDLERANQALLAAGAQQILGYRCPLGWLSPAELWVLDVLIDAGFRYDASMRPSLWSLREEHAQRRVHLYRNEKGSLWELPPPTVRMLGFNIPIAGGNYLRQLPQWFTLRGFQRWTLEGNYPFVLYFHPWELDGELPRIRNMGLLARIRQYRNLGRMAGQIETYLQNAEFLSVSQYLGIEVTKPAPATDETSQAAASARPVAIRKRRSMPTVTIVIPCYNEKSSLSYLAHALSDVERAAQDRYRFQYLFVDDASTDGTEDEVARMFAGREGCRILRHERNQGVAAAIQTGIKEATTEVVCSIDADCTYDPVELLAMIPLLTDEVAVVVASPYHRQGSVINVPKWRLLLSKHLSKGYHLVFHNKLATYSSCCRVYRRSAVVPYSVEHGNFIGIVELLAKVDHAGGKIVEFPAVLHSRLLGHSKMKVLRTIWGHLRLLMRLTWQRLHTRLRWRMKAQQASVPKPPVPEVADVVCFCTVAGKTGLEL